MIFKTKNIAELCAYKTKYQSKIEEIKPVDSKILNFLSHEEYEHKLTESLIREDAFIDVITKVDRVLTKIYNLETNNSEHSFVRETTSNHTRSPSNPTETVKVKLPKLELKPFDGNILNWQPFWDRFQSSIDSNSNISSVDKFAYLQSLSSPSTSEFISGLTTTAESYNEAVELLKQRYGNTQVLINAHIQQFVSSPVIKSVNNVKGRRKLGRFETQVPGARFQVSGSKRRCQVPGVRVHVPPSRSASSRCPGVRF